MNLVTTSELVTRYLLTRKSARRSTQSLHSLVLTHLTTVPFGTLPIDSVKTSDAKLFFLDLQSQGKGYSTIHNFRSVLRPAFQMAMDDDLIPKNPFAFQLATVIPKNTKSRTALSPEEENDFLRFLQCSPKWQKYYDPVFILFNTGLRISEFCGLTTADISFDTATLHITKQLVRYPGMEYALEPTKTSSGKRNFPLTKDLLDAFQRMSKAMAPTNTQNSSSASKPDQSELLEQPFLCRDRAGLPLTAFHWDKLFQGMLNDYNSTHLTPLPHITPHVLRHTFCTRMASAGMHPKSLQYLMGHSNISITLNVYTHIHQEDARRELERILGHTETSSSPTNT